MTHTPNINDSFVVAVLTELVENESVNPALELGSGRLGSGEAGVARAAVRHLETLGLRTELFEVSPGRPNVLATLPGTGGGRSLMLNGHLDTVGPGQMPLPFAARVHGGRLFGRGAYDMKGGIAAILGAVEALVRGGAQLNGDLVVALVIDEETASLGTEQVLTRVHTHGAIVTEATELELCVAHKGFVWLEVTTHGVAAHGSNVVDGVDANLRMAAVLTRLDQLAAALPMGHNHELVGAASMHAAVLGGGTGPSIYANESRLQIERRTIPGEVTSRVIAELTDELTTAAQASRHNNTPRFSTLLHREPFEVVADSAMLRAVEKAGSAVLGTSPRRTGVAYWTDAALLAAAGIDTVLFGPSGHGAHADEEWVDLSSVSRCAQVLADTALIYTRG